MPYYNYKCLDCESVTEVKASWQEKEQGLTVSCQKCHSKNTRHVFGTIAMSGRAAEPLTACGRPREQMAAASCQNGGGCACN